MFLSSFKTNREIYEPTLLFPQSYEWGAFASLLNGEYLAFFQSFGNSLVLSGGQAFLATMVSAGAGFALAKFRFRWAGVFSFLALMLIIFPKQSLAVSMFEWLGILGWQGSLWSLMLPGAVTGLGVVFFLQLFRNLPDEWLEIARIEGLSSMAYLSTSRTFGLSRFGYFFPAALRAQLAGAFASFACSGRREHDAPACFDQTSRCEFSDSGGSKHGRRHLKHTSCCPDVRGLFSADEVGLA